MINHRTLLNILGGRRASSEWLRTVSTHTQDRNHIYSTSWRSTFHESFSTQGEPHYIFTNPSTQPNKKISEIKVLQSNYRPAFNLIINCSTEENSRQFRSLLISHHIIRPTDHQLSTTETVYYTCQEESLTVTKLMTLLNQLKAFEPSLDEATYNSIVGTINSLSITGRPVIDDTLRRFEEFYSRQVAIFRPSQTTTQASPAFSENSSEISDSTLNQLALDVLNALAHGDGQINTPDFSTTTLYSSQRENGRTVIQMGDWEIASNPRRQHGSELQRSTGYITYRNQNPSPKISTVYIAGTDYNHVFNISVACPNPELEKELRCILILKGLYTPRHHNSLFGIIYHTTASEPETVTNLCDFLETLSSFDPSINPRILASMVSDINNLRTSGGPLIKISETDPRRVLIDEDFSQSVIVSAAQTGNRQRGNI